jgi:hypothetical protein
MVHLRCTAWGERTAPGRARPVSTCAVVVGCWNRDKSCAELRSCQRVVGVELAIRLANRTGEGHTSKDRVGAWSDHRWGARPVDRDGGCLGLGRRHGLRVRCCNCAREDGRGHSRGNAHPASWPQLLRAPATRQPPRALTSASAIRPVEADRIIALPHALPGTARRSESACRASAPLRQPAGKPRRCRAPSSSCRDAS